MIKALLVTDMQNICVYRKQQKYYERLQKAGAKFIRTGSNTPQLAAGK